MQRYSMGGSKRRQVLLLCRCCGKEQLLLPPSERVLLLIDVGHTVSSRAGAKTKMTGKIRTKISALGEKQAL